MFLSKKFVYLQLQKTGCSHIAALLADVVGGEQIGKHNRLPDELRGSGRRIIGSIRNPWDWYVSLWAYGCGGAGALHDRLTGKSSHGLYLKYRTANLIARMFGHGSAPTKKWASVYESSDDPEKFREWLFMIHDPANRSLLGENYGQSSISRFSGFLSYRYAHLYLDNITCLYSGEITSTGQFRKTLEKNTQLDFVIRTESLEDDLIAALRGCSLELKDEEIARIYERDRMNVSPRRRSVLCYYDQATIDLVSERETALIEIYGYRPPTLNS